MRVTHVVFDIDGGGMETLVATMARRYRGSRIAMSLITLGGRAGRIGSLMAPDLDQFHVLRPVSGLSMVAPLGVARCIRRTRPEVVHLHGGVWFKGALASRLARVPRVVYTEHGREHYDPPLLQRLDRIAARWTDVVVPVSERLGAYVHARLGVPVRKIRVVENGVDHERFAPGPDPAELRVRLGIPSDALVIGSIGRLEHVKAYERLVEAFRMLLEEGRVGDAPLHLVICGEGSARETLEAAVRESHLEGFVHLPGWSDQTTEFHRLFDVFVLTSRSEGTSVSLLEAMATARAMVVSDVGANARMLGPALSAQVVPSGDEAALLSALRTLLDSPERRRAVGNEARRRVLAHYSLDTMLASYAAIYAPDGSA